MEHIVSFSGTKITTAGKFSLIRKAVIAGSSTKATLKAKVTWIRALSDQGLERSRMFKKNYVRADNLKKCVKTAKKTAFGAGVR